MSSKKIAFYYTHYQCLGHTIRILSLIESVKRVIGTGARFYLFQGGLPQEFVDPPQYLNTINLPFPFYSRDNFEIPPRLILSEIELRARFLLNIIAKINPDIFITDYFPFGHRDAKYELLPVLQYLKRKEKTIICSLGYPFFSLQNLDAVSFFLRYYQKVMIHTPRIELTLALKLIKNSSQQLEYKSLLSNRKTKFCNYILPYNLEDKTSYGGDIYSRNKLVVVTRGAGAYYPKIISSAILAKRYFKDYYFLVVAGPSSTKEEWDLFVKLKNKYKIKNLVLKRFIPFLPNYLRRADLVISTASYNTATMLMYYKKRSVIIPFSGYSKEYSFWEQPARAELLSEKISTSVIAYSELTDETLRDRIKYQLEIKRTCKSLNRDWFNGAGKAAFEILRG